MAVCPKRAVPKFPVALHAPVAGSYSSPLTRLPLAPVSTLPPATSTCPFGSSVAVCPKRAVPKFPVALHAPVAGSYSSPLARLPAGATTPDDQHLPIRQQRGCMEGACRSQTSRCAPQPRRRVIQFRTGEKGSAGAIPPGDQHLPIWQQRGCVGERAVPISPVALDAAVAGSYSSALATLPAP